MNILTMAQEISLVCLSAQCTEVGRGKQEEEQEEEEEEKDKERRGGHC